MERLGWPQRQARDETFREEGNKEATDFSGKKSFGLPVKFQSSSLLGLEFIKAVGLQSVAVI